MDKESKKKLGLERIDQLFSELENASESEKDRYIDLARKIAMKCRISVPRKYKIMYCSHCYHFTGNSGVRARNGNLIYRCSRCKRLSKYSYRSEKLGKNKEGTRTRSSGFKGKPHS
jgi:ribonuclease P protein subunit RPR2